ncbi:hypothetical protein [Desulfoluna spongiiphila]|uniref:Uncharacterized protein n=1 Tax=Desulfoluna spongiiphila TaxID=419481 RepID=A0A1G5HCN8_9BACT|nr:hypothetical protein [Desulfoluna spongiiphila]SCY61632.1 hypothetical protein SAMN05216233_113105 [Desulfoluna spongiiphila]VVS94636.1 hypothetical protein DBB_42080 [Desulfoluna spongiiphila]
MTTTKKILFASGILQFALALFQAGIAFSPSLSLYFGAPESLVGSRLALMGTSFFVSGLLILFGLYALSGAGAIRPLPWLRQVLAVIGGIYLLRGLVLIPEVLVIAGVVVAAIPIAPRFVVMSACALAVGSLFVAGTVGGWASLSPGGDATP